MNIKRSFNRTNDIISENQEKVSFGNLLPKFNVASKYF